MSDPGEEGATVAPTVVDRAGPTLEGALRCWAGGIPGMGEAVRLLADSGWLADASFVRDCVVAVGTDASVAVVDWAAVAAWRGRRPDDERSATTLGEALSAAERAWADLGAAFGSAD